MEDNSVLLLLGGIAICGGAAYYYKKNKEKLEKLQKDKEAAEKKAAQAGQTTLSTLKTVKKKDENKSIFPSSDKVQGSGLDVMKMNGYWSDENVLKFLGDSMSKLTSDLSPLYTYWVYSSPWSMNGGMARATELFGSQINSNSEDALKVNFLHFFNEAKKCIGFNTEGANSEATSQFQESNFAGHADSLYPIAEEMLNKLSYDNWTPFAYQVEACNINMMIQTINPLCAIPKDKWNDFWSKKKDAYVNMTSNSPDETMMGFLDLVIAYNNGK